MARDALLLHFSYRAAGIMRAGNLALLMCWPALAILALCALGIERLGAAWLKVERRVRHVLVSAWVTGC